MQGGRNVRHVKVKLYTLSTCSHCRAAKKFLSNHGVEYEYTDVDLLPPDRKAIILAEVRKLNPMVSFPTIIIGDVVIVGNREEEIRRALEL
jgi:glutaredoxin-like protein NrdH